MRTPQEATETRSGKPHSGTREPGTPQSASQAPDDDHDRGSGPLRVRVQNLEAAVRAVANLSRRLMRVVQEGESWGAR